MAFQLSTHKALLTHEVLLHAEKGTVTTVATPVPFIGTELSSLKIAFCWISSVGSESLRACLHSCRGMGLLHSPGGDVARLA